MRQDRRKLIPLALLALGTLVPTESVAQGTGWSRGFAKVIEHAFTVHDRRLSRKVSDRDRV